MSKTLKIHVMEDHVSKYIKLTNKPLGHRTEQTTEAAHQYLNKRLRKSNYYVTDIQSEAHGLKFLDQFYIWTLITFDYSNIIVRYKNNLVSNTVLPWNYSYYQLM